ncbi:BRCT domain-containing protein [Shewanella mangrovisoli]|uniref:BRCT domain-containing protein n=1 Tax=Shewanella mangrovisoli TaxID=2864211 RepID=UPI0035B97910
MRDENPLLDKDGQPYSRVNFKHNKQKALCSLKGVLTGVICDQKLKPSELLYLESWLNDNEFLQDDADTADLLDAIGDVLNDRMITDEEHEDIFCLLEDVIAYKTLDDSKCKDHMNVLIGILKGITADADINDAEVLFFKKWLSENPDIANIWPVPKLTEKLDQILLDRVITSEERKDLYQLVTMLIGNDFSETGDAADSPTQSFDNIMNITHKDKCFCFTGKFKQLKRVQLEDKAKSLGAVIAKKIPTLSTDYVVVGSLSSRDWLYSSHGLKIQHAKKMQESGHHISIISEDQWLASL